MYLITVVTESFIAEHIMWGAELESGTEKSCWMDHSYCLEFMNIIHLYYTTFFSVFFL